MRVRFSPLAPGYKKKSICALIFYDRPYEKDHVVGLLAPEQKRKNGYVLYFFGRLYEKICEAKLLALISLCKMLEIV